MLRMAATLQNGVQFEFVIGQRAFLNKNPRGKHMPKSVLVNDRRCSRAGADRNAIFTRKHVKNLKGDQVLRKQAMMPKDLCVALSEETGGSLFNTIKWLSGKRNSQKRFVDVMVRVIAKKASPTSCQICECVPDMTGTGMAVCRDCQTPAPIYNVS